MSGFRVLVLTEVEYQHLRTFVGEGILEQRHSDHLRMMVAEAEYHPHPPKSIRDVRERTSKAVDRKLRSHGK